MDEAVTNITCPGRAVFVPTLLSVKFQFFYMKCSI